MSAARDIPANPDPSTGKRSQLEDFVEAILEDAGYETNYEPVTIHSQGRTYRPDYICICAHSSPNGARTIIEVKPNREIAAIELRNDMLVETSSLWIICDIFIVAFAEMPWMCRTKYGEWHDCWISHENGLVIDSSPSDWMPADPAATREARKRYLEDGRYSDDELDQ